MNVIVLDKSGKPLSDLSKEDFEVFDDGRPQDVAVFIPEYSAPAARQAASPNEFSNQFTMANAARSGYSMILLDWLNSSLYTRITSQQNVLRLLKQIEMRDLVSLCVLDRGFRVLNDFTADRAALVNRISAAYLALRDLPPDDPVALSQADSLGLSPVELSISGMNRYFGRRRVLDTFDALEQIANYLGSVPGRKSLIWVTSGFPSAFGYDRDPKDDLSNVEAWSRSVRTERLTFSPEMDRLVRRLNTADIAVYPVDARGLLVSSGGRINLASMKEVASRTGGLAFYDRNDIDNAMRTALDDSRVSYTLGYYLNRSENDGKYHNIRVKLRRTDVTIRYRSGYQAQGKDKASARPKIGLNQVLGSPLDTTLLPLSAHVEKNGETLDLRIRIDPSSLTLRSENGRRKGKVTIFFGFRPEGRSGRLEIDSVSSGFDLNAEQYQSLLKREMTFRKQLAVPPQATSLRLVVRDEESASMGSVTIPISAVH